MIEYLFSLELKNKTEKAFSLQGELLLVRMVLKNDMVSTRGWHTLIPQNFIPQNPLIPRTH